MLLLIDRNVRVNLIRELSGTKSSSVQTSVTDPVRLLQWVYEPVYNGCGFIIMDCDIIYFDPAI